MPPATVLLRPAVIADAPLVADLETACAPNNLRDPVMATYWWTHPHGGEVWKRWVAGEGGELIMFAGAAHGDLGAQHPRYGRIRVRLHPDAWDSSAFLAGVDTAESWLRGENVEIAVAQVHDDQVHDLEALDAAGYREVRRMRVWRLDLDAGRERLLAAAEMTRAEMRRQGVRLLTLDQDHDPEVMRKLYALDREGTDDIPKTVPWPEPSFEEWQTHWFEHPGHRRDRFWIAREGDDVVGMSIIGYPPVRGLPWTSFTTTARTVRGRGIARALKHETVAQAIALGAKLVETANDAENAPILHLNQEMGYSRAGDDIELHRTL
jgi:hypothetical protein